MQDMLAKDREFIWHPFTKQKNQAAPTGIARGTGTLLYDIDNQSYVDAISSWWVTIHGHGHPYIAEKIYQQALTLEQVIFAGFTHQPAAELAARLVPCLPGSFHKIFFSDNGSTSTEVALKMALQYWWNLDEMPKRKKILAFRNSYHGDTFGAMGVSERSVFTLAFHDFLMDVVFMELPSEENIGALEQFILETGDETAAFIYEPLVQGAGGIIMYEAEWMNRLLRACRAKDIICIADEVMTGFGRTGRMFASEYMEEKPDIICLSKGLTGGVMAMGITACNERIYQAYLQDDALKTFFHGHSFTANPLACTAALASLDLFEKNNSLAQINEITRRNEIFLQNLKPYEEKGIIRNTRMRGTILAFELASSAPDGYLNPAGQFFAEMSMQKGVFMRPLGNTAYIMPPYCITETEMEKVFATILEILDLLPPVIKPPFPGSGKAPGSDLRA